MTSEDWETLEHLGMLEVQKKLSPIGRDNYFTLLGKSKRADNCPEDYAGPCMCRTCMSYGD